MSSTALPRPGTGNLSFWLRAARVFSFTASLVPIVLGTLIAWQFTRHFSLPVFLAALTGGILLHAAANMAGDYFDYKNGIDRPDTLGGSRVLPEGLAGPEAILHGALACFAMAMLPALFMIGRCGWGVAVFGLAGMAGGWFYAARPLQLKYRALGDVCVFVFFGVLMTLGACCIQVWDSGAPPRRLLLAIALLHSIPAASLTSAIVHANNHRDIVNDRASGIKTLAGLLGEQNSRRLYYFYVALACLYPVAWVALSAALPGLSPRANAFFLLPLLSLPAALPALKKMRRPLGDPALNDADVATAKYHLVFGILYLPGIALGFSTGV